MVKDCWMLKVCLSVECSITCVLILWAGCSISWINWKAHHRCHLSSSYKSLIFVFFLFCFFSFIQEGMQYLGIYRAPPRQVSKRWWSGGKTFWNQKHGSNACNRVWPTKDTLCICGVIKLGARLRPPSKYISLGGFWTQNMNQNENCNAFSLFLSELCQSITLIVVYLVMDKASQ